MLHKNENKILENKDNPIFVQSLWRTGSTYIWRKFRENKSLLSYAKPFHHSLSKSSVMLQKDFSHASQRFGFEKVKKSYYEEYDAGRNGVPLYNWKFAVEDYILQKEMQSQALEKYLSRLIKKAHDKQKRPMLQFNRGVMRGERLNQKFSATSLYLIRSPIEMLESYNRLASPNVPYYMTCYMGILGANKDNIVFEEMSNYMNTPYKKAKSFKEHFLFYNRLANALTDTQKRDVVSFFWSLGLINATSYASDTLDMALSNKETNENKIEIFQSIVKSTTGEKIDFSDLSTKPPQEKILETSTHVKKIINEAIQNLKLPEQTLNRINDFSISKNTRDQLDHVLG